LAGDLTYFRCYATIISSHHNLSHGLAVKMRIVSMISNIDCKERKFWNQLNTEYVVYQVNVSGIKLGWEVTYPMKKSDDLERQIEN
jgi:hypothetical protein